MSLFPNSFINRGDSSFFPIFRLFNEFDHYAHDNGSLIHPKSTSFSPKFDVKEQNGAYELYGELPGIHQNDVELEFINDNTLVVKGHIENSYTQHMRPSGFIQGEILNDDLANEVNFTQSVTEEPKEIKKIWLQERKTGSFSRSFTFPENVDPDEIRASMKNGILSIFVPKARKPKKCKIVIE